MENKKKRMLWTLAVCAAAVLLVAAVCLIIRYYPQIKGLMQPENMERFRALLDSFGIAGALILIAIQIAQVLSGVIFFSQNAWDGWSAWGYSLTYHLSCKIPEGILTLVILMILPLNTLKKAAKGAART